MPEDGFVVPRSQFRCGYEFPAWTEIKRKLSLAGKLAFYPAHRKDPFSLTDAITGFQHSLSFWNIQMFFVTA